MNDTLISIIIRTKNEERWISSCLKAIMKQTYQNFEIVIVDNQSSDRTIQKAKQFNNIIYVDCLQYIPGYSLNLGIKASKGDFIVCLSGHCIPTNEYWLENLFRNFNDDEVGGVYGRQEPLSFTSDADKRDLAIVFGLDKKIQRKDSFFHNANSMIRRSLWEEVPFDETLTNIEDRIWAQSIVKMGYIIIYEPEASVYHHHGIHQDGNEERCKNVIRIIEEHTPGYIQNYFMESDRNIVSIIPSKGLPPKIKNKSLLEYTIESSLQSKYVVQTYVSTDNIEAADIARKHGADVPFIREAILSEDYVNLQQVYQYSLEKLEEQDIFPDLLVFLEPTYPFRPNGLIDEMITEFLKNGLDCLIAGKEEFRPIIQKSEDEFIILSEGLTPRNLGVENYIGLKGVCTIVLPDIIRKGGFFGENTGIFSIHSEIVHFEVRSENDISIAENILNN